jgi:hypothetical protein
LQRIYRLGRNEMELCEWQVGMQFVGGDCDSFNILRQKTEQIHEKRSYYSGQSSQHWNQKNYDYAHYTKMFHSLQNNEGTKQCNYTAPHGAAAPRGPGSSHYQDLTITLRHPTVGTTPLNEWSARRRKSYLTTYNTHKRQTSMPPAGFETTILASERPDTQAWDRAVTGIGVTIDQFYT